MTVETLCWCGHRLVHHEGWTTVAEPREPVCILCSAEVLRLRGTGVTSTDPNHSFQPVEPSVSEEAARITLNEYLTHGDDCTWWKRPPLNQQPCSCGLEQAVEAVQRAAISDGDKTIVADLERGLIAAHKLADAEAAISDLRDQLKREVELRQLIADAIERGDDVPGALAALRHLSTELPTAADAEWARSIVARQDAARLRPSTDGAPATGGE